MPRWRILTSIFLCWCLMCSTTETHLGEGNLYAQKNNRASNLGAWIDHEIDYVSLSGFKKFIRKQGFNQVTRTSVTTEDIISDISEKLKGYPNITEALFHLLESGEELQIPKGWILFFLAHHFNEFGKPDESTARRLFKIIEKYNPILDLFVFESFISWRNKKFTFRVYEEDEELERQALKVLDFSVNPLTMKISSTGTIPSDEFDDLYEIARAFPADFYHQDWESKRGEFSMVIEDDPTVLYGQPYRTFYIFLEEEHEQTEFTSEWLQGRKWEAGGEGGLGKVVVGIAEVDYRLSFLVRIQPNPWLTKVRPRSRRNLYGEWYKGIYKWLMRAGEEYGIEDIYAVPIERLLESHPPDQSPYYQRWKDWTKQRNLVIPFKRWETVVVEIDRVYDPFSDNLSSDEYALLKYDAEAAERDIWPEGRPKGESESRNADNESLFILAA